MSTSSNLDTRLKVGSLSGREQIFDFKGFTILSGRERFGLAAGTGMAFLFAAGIFLFVPALHFFLVPLCVLLAPLMAWSSYRKHYRFPPPQKLNCLDCEKAVEMEKKYVELPYTMTCRECGARMTIYPP